MADVVTFDPINLRIIEINSGLTTNVLDLVEIYSEWKDWILGDPQRAGYPSAFRVVGGDPISDVQNLGSTFFLNTGAGWRIRPAEYDHQLAIVGNLFTDPAGEITITSTIGAFTVLVEQRVSNLTDTSVASLDLLALQNTVYIDTIDGTAGTTGDIGSPTSPVNNLADARTISDNINLRSFTLRGEITLDQDYSSWKFDSVGSEESSIVNLNGQNVDQSAFTAVEVAGAGTGHIDVTRCALGTLSGIEGDFRNCSFKDTITLGNGSNGISHFDNCFSGVPGTGRPFIYMTTDAEAGFRHYSGGIEIFDMAAGNVVSVDMNPGTVFLGPTNVGGNAMLRGTGVVFDTSAGTTVTNQVAEGGNTTDEIADAVWEALASSYSDDLTMGGRILADLGALIAAGGNLTPDQATQLIETWQVLGLDPQHPLIVDSISRVAGTAVTQSIEENVPVAGSVRITKQ